MDAAACLARTQALENDEPHDELQRSREVIMALDVGDDGCMGCAFFDSVDDSLHLAEDVHQSTVDMSEHFAMFACPTSFLISSRAPRELLDYMQNGFPPQKSCIRVVSSSEFSVELAVDRLSGCRMHTPLKTVPSFRAPANKSALFGPYDVGVAMRPDAGGTGPEWNIDDISGEQKNRVSLGCAGAVVSELRRKGIVDINLTPGPTPSRQISIKTFNLASFVALGPETLQALQIIRSELHPNSQYWGGRGQKQDQKESLSIYGLFQDHSHTPQGRAKLYRLVLHPVSNITIIRNRQQAIALFLLPQNAARTRQITEVIRGIRDAKVYALELRDLIIGLTDDSNHHFIRTTIPKFNRESLLAVGELISNNIDFEQSEYRGRPTVRLGLDIDLDRLRRDYDGMHSFLKEMFESTIQKVPQWAVSCIRSCIFLPQLGFFVAIELDSSTGKGKYHSNWPVDDHWEQIFVADNSVYYKNDNMRHLDEQLGDVYCEIADREVEILHALSQEVLKFSEPLSLASDTCGDVNVILALGLTAEKYKWTVPVLTTKGNILNIRKGRHPLQELVVPCFIPNDCHLGSGDLSNDELCQNQASCMIVTGPNQSGKSVFLKQVGLIVYLAHIGSFVPAEVAVIGVTDRILTRISTLESVGKEESAFAVDLKQLHNAIRQSTSRSLLIIDEFGKGTNSDDDSAVPTMVEADVFVVQLLNPLLPAIEGVSI
ncbi:MutS protein msh5 [Metarhizium rileyi]|uniref:MutS protein msh5 n=1 Tax=Metarhizium rileyi (strain RCEF 4871) TaxID=1649241 RepID=A0A5C6GDN0_METRR|nr:MutS protein msh5 [Metarhizium rileyi]